MGWDALCVVSCCDGMGCDVLCVVVMLEGEVYETNDEAADAFDAEAAEAEDMQVAAADDMEEFETL